MMLFKKTKQTLAALLCLCMVAAILPAGVPAAKAATAATYTFCPLSGVKDGTVVNTIAQSTTGNWKFHSSSLDASATKYYKTYGLQTANIGEDQWVAYELYNATKGYYSTKFNYLYSNSGTDAELYLIPAAATVDISACNDSTYLGFVEFSRYVAGEPADSDKDASIDLNNVFIPNDGNYILVLKSTGKMHYGSYQYLWVKGFELSPLADGIYANIGNDTLIEGKNTDLKVEIAVNGEKINDAYSVNFSDPTVASYSASTGKITALKPGSTDITVSYGSYSKVIELTVNAFAVDVNIKGMGIGIWELIDGISADDTNGVWAYHSSNTYYGANQAVPLAAYDCIEFRSTGDSKDRYVAFEMYDLKSGNYSVEVTTRAYNGGGLLDFYVIPSCDEIDLDEMCTVDTFVGRVDFYENIALADAADRVSKVKNINIDSDGDYIIVARGTGRSRSVQGAFAVMSNFNMTRVGDVVEAKAGNEAFSETYAYVREMIANGNTTYVVTLIGGINVDDLAAYENVGFEISSERYNGTLTAKNIYKSLTLSDATISAESFGVDYFFVQTFSIDVEDVIDALDFMTINAVAETSDGDIIEGVEYTLQFAK